MHSCTPGSCARVPKGVSNVCSRRATASNNCKRSTSPVSDWSRGGRTLSSKATDTALRSPVATARNKAPANSLDGARVIFSMLFMSIYTSATVTEFLAEPRLSPVPGDLLEIGVRVPMCAKEDRL